MGGARPDVVPLAEAAERLELSTEAVRKRIQRGTLPGRKVDGAWFVEAAHLPPASSSAGRPAAPVRPSAGRQDDGVETSGPATDGGTDGGTTPEPAPSVDLAPLAGVIEALTRENRELAAAAALWQERARVLEGRLLALGAGDAPAGPSSPPSSYQNPVTSGDTDQVPRPATEALMLRWRRWFRRMADG